MLAERRERLASPAGEGDERRIERLEPDRVADHVGPHPRAGRDDDRVVHAALDVAQPVPGGPGRIELVGRDEFVEDPVVVDQAEQLRPRIAEGDEALGAGIGLQQSDPVSPGSIGKPRGRGRT